MADLKRIRRSILATTIGVCTLWAAAMAPAHASLVGTTVDVTVDSPNDGPFTASNTGVLVGAGVEISAGDGSNVGDNAMLSGEFIDIGGFSIMLRLVAGEPGPPPVTGWGTNARYIFSGLGMAGFDIVGVTATSSFGITNFDSSWASFDSPSQVSFRVDLIEFSAGIGGVTAYGDVNLALQTRATGGGGGTVPEPGSLALVAMAMLTLWWASRRREIS